jgi:hypothetical protein
MLLAFIPNFPGFVWRQNPLKHLRKRLGGTMLGTVLIVLLILALLGAFPRWGYSRDWGYWPSGGLGFVLLIVLVLVLMGRI